MHGQGRVVNPFPNSQCDLRYWYPISSRPKIKQIPKIIAMVPRYTWGTSEASYGFFSNIYDKFLNIVCIAITEGKIGLITEMKTEDWKIDLIGL